VAPLYWTGILGHPLNMLWGMDRLLLGILAGSLVFWGTGWWYFRLKARNEGRAHIPFQKVAMPVGALLIFSLIFYFLIR